MVLRLSIINSIFLAIFLISSLILVELNPNNETVSTIIPLLTTTIVNALINSRISSIYNFTVIGLTLFFAIIVSAIFSIWALTIATNNWVGLGILGLGIYTAAYLLLSIFISLIFRIFLEKK